MLGFQHERTGHPEEAAEGTSQTHRGVRTQTKGVVSWKPRDGSVSRTVSDGQMLLDVSNNCPWIYNMAMVTDPDRAVWAE